MVADIVIPMSDKVNALKCVMLTMPQWQPTDDQCRHFFGGGIYARWLARPAGTTIVGKVHKKAHLYFVVSGTIAVTTDDGLRQITGPEIISCKPGTQRAVVAITDALCVVFVRVETESQDLAEVENEIAEPMPESPYLPGNRLPELTCQS